MQLYNFFILNQNLSAKAFRLVNWLLNVQHSHLVQPDAALEGRQLLDDVVGQVSDGGKQTVYMLDC